MKILISGRVQKTVKDYIEGQAHAQRRTTSSIMETLLIEAITSRANKRLDAAKAKGNEKFAKLIEKDILSLTEG